MASKLSVMAVCGLTGLQVFWLWMIARQNAPFLMATVVVAAVLLSAVVAVRKMKLRRVLEKVAVGAVVGYGASLLAAVASECGLRGAACLDRDFSQNLYFFPIASFAWVYGALIFALLVVRDAE